MKKAHKTFLGLLIISNLYSMEPQEEISPKEHYTKLFVNLLSRFHLMEIALSRDQTVSSFFKFDQTNDITVARIDAAIQKEINALSSDSYNRQYKVEKLEDIKQKILTQIYCPMHSLPWSTIESKFLIMAQEKYYNFMSSLFARFSQKGIQDSTTTIFEKIINVEEPKALEMFLQKCTEQETSAFKKMGLFSCARNGFLLSLQFLISKGTDPNSRNPIIVAPHSKNPIKYVTPLYCAVINNKFDCAQTLLEFDANPNSIFWELTPFTYAFLYCYNIYIKLFLEGTVSKMRTFTLKELWKEDASYFHKIPFDLIKELACYKLCQVQFSTSENAHSLFQELENKKTLHPQISERIELLKARSEYEAKVDLVRQYIEQSTRK